MQPTTSTALSGAPIVQNQPAATVAQESSGAADAIVQGSLASALQNVTMSGGSMGIGDVAPQTNRPKSIFHL